MLKKDRTNNLVELQWKLAILWTLCSHVLCQSQQTLFDCLSNFLLVFFWLAALYHNNTAYQYSLP